MPFVDVLDTSDNSILPRRLKSKRAFLKIGHFNTQSLKANNGCKVNEISRILHGNFLNVVGVCKKWLKSYVTICMVGIPGYKIIRNERECIKGGV